MMCRDKRFDVSDSGCTNARKCGSMWDLSASRHSLDRWFHGEIVVRTGAR